MNIMSPKPPDMLCSVAGNFMSIAACEIEKTVIINPQLMAVTDRKKPSVWPESMRRKGSKKKTQTGMKTINKPYQPI